MRIKRTARFERALFVVGHPHWGKSYQLRSMFLDWRFGNDGEYLEEDDVKRPPLIHLSNERLLHVRFTAPQEIINTKTRKPETPSQYFAKLDSYILRQGPTERWNYATPMRHTGKLGPSSDGIPMIGAFIGRYDPERVRVAVLNPPQDTEYRPKHPRRLSGEQIEEKVNSIRKLDDRVETLILDAREQNGLLLADFFNFA